MWDSEGSGVRGGTVDPDDPWCCVNAEEKGLCVEVRVAVQATSLS